jgi:hypothetical protein
MSTILLILAYWVGTGFFISILMYAALQFANLCAYIVDIFTTKDKIHE